MGLKGLQAYMENVSSSAIPPIRNVSLIEMIKTFKKQNPDITKPILVVDGHNCMYELYSGFDWICSGQWIEFVAALHIFVKSLQNLGLKLVFFFDGCTKSSKREEWFKRRMDYVNDTKQIYSFIHGKRHVPQQLFRLPASMGTLIRYALKYVCKVPVYTVITEDCDQIVATFAKKHNCIGILTQDSDFVIYDTVPFISIKHLNLNSMQTVVYDRNMFCTRENIKVAQLPLLACLMGNDFVSRESLTSFHKRQTAATSRVAGKKMSYNSRIIVSIIEFIRNMSLEGNTRDNNHLRAICHLVFGNMSRLEDLRKGMEMYILCYDRCDPYRNPFETNPMTDNVLSTFKIFDYMLEKCINTDQSETLYHVVVSGTCDFGPSLEDENNSTFQPEVLVYRPIRSRLYDFILAFRNKYIDSQDTFRRTGLSPSSKDYVEEQWVTSSRPHSAPDKVYRAPVRINEEIPDLWTLWTDSSQATQQLKWVALTACLNLSQSIKCLIEIPDKFKLLCMMINYLIQSHEVRMKSWEVDAFLVQCVIPNAFNVAWVKNLKVTPYDAHAVHLAALFYRGTTQFYSVLNICGEPFPIENSMPWDYFDGKRFHHCYTALKQNISIQQLCLNNKQSLDQFELLKKCTYENLK